MDDRLGCVAFQVLITGASRGLGLALSDVFLAAGNRVFAAYREPSAGLEALAARHAERLTTVPLDVTRASEVLSARTRVEQHTPALDILINNAAILPATGRGRLENLNVEVGLEVYDTNALGPLRVTQAFLPLLRAGGRKLIVNVSSEAGSVGDCGRRDEHLYCMSKSALNMQSAIVKNDLEPEGFQILVVHPGWMRTDMGGPTAHIDALEAAQGIFELVGRPHDSTDAYYLDYRGNALRW